MGGKHLLGLVDKSLCSEIFQLTYIYVLVRMYVNKDTVSGHYLLW